MTDDKRAYLGDGVYASFDGYQVWVWTSDGIMDSKKIALDPDIIASLVSFYERERSVPIRLTPIGVRS